MPADRPADPVELPNIGKRKPANTVPPNAAMLVHNLIRDMLSAPTPRCPR